MAKLSPMMTQYMQLKEAHDDCLLFFRLGDFYELFFEDAILASQELELTLTGRDCGLEERAPMCGVPYHAVEIYINKLLKKGYKVAICEQTTLPEKGKKLVERDVVRIVTPGTIIEDALLNDNQNNYLVSLYKDGEGIGIAYADISTGEFYISEINKGNLTITLYDELTRINPAEIMVNEDLYKWLVEENELTKTFDISHDDKMNSFFKKDFAKALFRKHFSTKAEIFISDDTKKKSIYAAGALINYLNITQKNSLLHINEIKDYEINQYMGIDSFTRKSLELVTTIRKGSKRGSLLWVIDKTITSIGSRKIKKWLQQPLLNKQEIKLRLDAVDSMTANVLQLKNIQDELKSIKDIERLTTKIAYASINPRECQQLCQSLEVLPQIKDILNGIDDKYINSLRDNIDSLEDVFTLLNDSITDEPPNNIKDGGFIKEGYNQELNEIRKLSTNGKQLLDNMEIAERQATGIKKLRIGYNRVFGYYIEVTKSFVDLVPYRYTRKQTLTNAERYITPELKELEENILSAQQKGITIEQKLFNDIKNALKQQIPRLQKSADEVAKLDAIQSMATVAIDNSYVKPKINTNGIIDIKDSRHPVVELATNNNLFVPNNVGLNMTDERFLIITGPNMSGKSTYLRQVAVIIIMAHIGSFVPASYADIALTDRVFSRVGASDDLFMGLSTFMVEMSEVAHILKNATSDSLIILDEIGRGTSTFDGLSIAWSVIEHIADKQKIGAKTLFATHYHELSELEGRVEGVKNYCIAVREYKSEIIFLRKIIRGGADKSFGLHVAKLAGLPNDVLERGKELYEKLETADINNTIISDDYINNNNEKNESNDTKLIDEEVIKLIKEIEEMDLTQTTPIETFYLIKRMKDIL